MSGQNGGSRLGENEVRLGGIGIRMQVRGDVREEMIAGEDEEKPIPRVAVLCRGVAVLWVVQCCRKEKR